jgi:hypothetical protein
MMENVLDAERRKAMEQGKAADTVSVSSVVRHAVDDFILERHAQIKGHILAENGTGKLVEVSPGNKWGIRTQLVEYERTYGQLFPADHPLSPLMLRLMIIRDDLSFELDGIILRQDDGPDLVWRNTYFMRRISSSVTEAQNVLRQQEFGKYIKQEWKGTIIDTKVREVAAEIESLLQLFGDLRNDLGGHVRPGETEAGLRAHKNWKGVIVRNVASAYRTSYRQFTVIAPLFVWPEVVDLETFAAKHDKLSTAIPRAVGALLNGIDGLLQAFWIDLPDAKMEVPPLTDEGGR